MERKTFNKVEVHSRLGIARTSSAMPSARRTFSVVFFCKKTKVTKKGKAPIYVRIKICGTATEIYTRCQIEPERWNQRLERSLYKDDCSAKVTVKIDGWAASAATIIAMAGDTINVYRESSGGSETPRFYDQCDGLQ